MIKALDLIVSMKLQAKLLNPLKHGHKFGEQLEEKEASIKCIYSNKDTLYWCQFLFGNKVGQLDDLLYEITHKRYFAQVVIQSTQ